MGLRNRAKIVAFLDLMFVLIRFGLFGFLVWGMGSNIWLDSLEISMLTLSISVSILLLIQVLAPALLYVAALARTTPGIAIKLCHFWGFLNTSGIGLLAFILFKIRFLLSVRGVIMLGITVIIITITEIVFRLSSIYIAVRLCKALKSEISGQQEEFEFMPFTNWGKTMENVNRRRNIDTPINYRRTDQPVELNIHSCVQTTAV